MEKAEWKSARRGERGGISRWLSLGSRKTGRCGWIAQGFLRHRIVVSLSLFTLMSTDSFLLIVPSNCIYSCSDYG